jgi:hypothetical protein
MACTHGKGDGEPPKKAAKYGSIFDARDTRYSSHNGAMSSTGEAPLLLHNRVPVNGVVRSLARDVHCDGHRDVPGNDTVDGLKQQVFQAGMGSLAACIVMFGHRRSICVVHG